MVIRIGKFSNEIAWICFAFQSDDSWKDVTFSSYDNIIDDVIKIAVEFESFPNQQVSVKDLVVHTCISGGMW